MSVDGSAGAALSPASTEGDAMFRWKSKFVASTKFGSAEKFPFVAANPAHPSVNSEAFVDRTTGGMGLYNVLQLRPSAITSLESTAFPAYPHVFTPPFVFRATVLFVNSTCGAPTERKAPWP